MEGEYVKVASVNDTSFTVTGIYLVHNILVFILLRALRERGGGGGEEKVSGWGLYKREGKVCYITRMILNTIFRSVTWSDLSIYCGCLE